MVKSYQKPSCLRMEINTREALAANCLSVEGEMMNVCVEGATPLQSAGLGCVMILSENS